MTAHTRKPKRMLDELAENLPEEPVILDPPDAEEYTQDDRPLKYIRSERLHADDHGIALVGAGVSL